MTRLLLTVDESTGSLAAARGLRAAGYEPWIALTERGTYVDRSRAVAGRLEVPSPAAGADGYAEAVAAAAAEARVAAVLPATEATLRALTGRQEMFEPVALGAAPPDATDRATDKSLLMELAREAGLRTPETRIVRAGDAVDASYPAILKPLRSVVARADGAVRKEEARIVRGESEVEPVLAADPEREWLLQPYVAGTLGAISGVAWQGRVVCSVQQVAHRIWPPRRGITAFGETIDPDPRLTEAVELIVQRIGWSGVFQLQVIRADGQIYAIDFNPRIYGSTALAVAAGANLPAIWAAFVLGAEPPRCTPRPGVRYRVEEDDVRALAMLARQGEVATALRGLLPRRRTTHAVFSLRDPLPALTTLAKARARRR